MQKSYFVVVIFLIVSSHVMAILPIVPLASFSSANSEPDSNIVFDASGDIYGTTFSGGTNHFGTVYELPAAGNSIITRGSFTAFVQGTGARATAGVISDAAGNLFGTTQSGGTNNVGTIFEIPAGSNSISTLASFPSNFTSSAYPSSLYEDSTGNLYGTTVQGPSGTPSGTIFELPVHSSNIVTVAPGFGAGEAPSASNHLTADPQGNLYGTTSSGGNDDAGTIFKFNPANQQLVTLSSFSYDANGYFPSALSRDTAGDLFGATEGGGDGTGAIFELPAGGNTIKTVFAPDQSVVGYVTLAVMVDSAGNVFGTESGGTTGNGLIFEIPAGSSSMNTLAQFNGTNGENPLGVAIGPDGNLYGVTSAGGNSGHGTVFEIVLPEPGLGALFVLSAFVAASHRRTNRK